MIDTKALRQKILDMAIKGKLVPQNPDDEPASVLLERIRAEKQQLIKEGKIKKDKNDSIIYKGDDNRYYEKVGSEVKDITDELPFEIPDNWVWIRLGYIVDFSQSDTVAASQINPSSWVLDLEDIEKDSGKLLQRKTFGETQSKSDKHCFFKGNVLYSKLRPYLNKVIVADADGYCTTEILAFNFGQHIAAQYAKTFFMSPYFVDYAMDGAYGVKMPRIGSHRGNSALMPVPPYTEQIHLVNRIDELFEQIDIIEQNQTDIDTLYDEFRKRTLTLAIQGKLVPQNPNDEPASVLLERIRAEKKAKLGKKYVDSYIYKSDDNCYYEHIAGRAQDELVEVPFDIPYGWSWCRLAIFAQVLGGKRIPAGRQLTNENTGHYYIKVSDMKENTVCLDKLQFVPTDIYPTISRYIINKEDVYITVAGTIGRVGTIPNELDGANLTENADRIVIDEIDQHWLVKCLLSDVIQEQIKEATTKVGQPKLAIARIEKFLIPLPPLAEQKRIVAKINEIFAML